MAIDPLEETDFGQDEVPPKRQERRRKTSYRDRNPRIFPSTTESQHRKTRNGVIGDVNEVILEEEALLLQTLPSDFLFSFRYVMTQLVPRTAIIALTIHVMMLIPLLRYIKFGLHMSVVPFLYLGPTLFLIPYIGFYLWDNGVTDVSVIDQYLTNYVAQEQVRNIDVAVCHLSLS
jgi:hypothetical protein